MTTLVSHRSTVITPDTSEALLMLERAGAERGGVRIQYGGVSSVLASWEGVSKDPGPTGLPAPLSLRPAGREVYLSAVLEDNNDPMAELSTLWALAVPLGFMPWSRYPVPGPQDQVFHYLGPWNRVADFLHGEGRGEHAWPSVCAAAQCEVHKWAGPKPTEREIQANLHRLGINCGPIDGDLGERTLASVRALGISGLPSSEIAKVVASIPHSPTKVQDRQVGYFTMKGAKVSAFCSGQVQAIRTKTGYSVTTDGSGRLILVFGESP